MKRLRKLMLLVVMMLAVMSSHLVYAAENQVVSIIQDNVTGSSTINKAPKISVSGNGYRVTEDISWSKAPKYWKSGEEIKGQMTLETNSGYVFASEISLSSVCNDANVSIVAERRSDTKAVLNFTLVIEREYEGDLKKVRFKDYESGDQYLEWRSVKGANKYILEFFFSSNDEYIETYETTNTKFNLRKVRNDVEKDERWKKVYCEIRAVSNKDYLGDSEVTVSRDLSLEYDDDKPDWENRNPSSSGGPGSIIITTPSPSSSSYYWKQFSDGSWYWTNGRSNYTGWQEVDGRWYYLRPGENGRMAAGWEYVDGHYYYLNRVHDGTYGAMLAGWQWIDGEYYYLNPVHDGTYGRMLTGWQWYNGNRYYFYGNGKMARNTWQDGVYLNSNGVAQ